VSSNSSSASSTTALATPVDLRVSAYERVASLLIALLFIVGFLVFTLFLVWWANRAVAVNRPVEIKAVEDLAGRGDNALGIARDLEEPGVEELAEVDTPQLSDTLAAVTTAVTLQPATLDEMLGDAERVGRGQGAGDSRGEGPGGEGDGNVVPRWDRWEIRFSAGLVETYARQLDFFGIELAAMGGGKAEVEYASRLSRPQPVRRSASGEGETRLRFAWKSGQLQEFDRQLLAKAGVDVHERVVVQFAPASLENELARLEREHSQGRDVSEIRKTVFGVESAGDGFQLTVVRQDFRP
jgi:hypothetical protein